MFFPKLDKYNNYLQKYLRNFQNTIFISKKFIIFAVS